MSQDHLEARIEQLEKELAAREAREAALLRNEEHIRPILESSPIGVVIFRVSDKVMTFGNSRCYRLFGYEAPHEVIGKSLRDFWIEPAQLRDLCDRAMATGEADLAEAALRGRDGSVFWANVSCEKILLDQEICLLFWINDVTAFKQSKTEIQSLNEGLEQTVQERTEQVHLSEERFRDFAANGADWFWELGPDLRISYISGNTDMAIGRMTQDFVGLTHSDVFGAVLKLDSIDQKNPLEIIDQHLPFSEIEVPWQLPGGPRRHVTLSGTPRFDEDGTFLGFRGICREITERKKVEEALYLAKREAEAASKAKSDFLASMSHELRTPLNAILGFAQILQINTGSPLTAEQLEQVGYIAEGGKHLLSLINQVLDLARIEADRLDLSLTSVDASEMIKECAALSIPLGKPRQISIFDELSQTITSTLHTDKVRLKQILLNLISNAIKYNKEAGTITLSGHETKNGFLHISITDTGIGISDKDRTTIFQMFQRARTRSTDVDEGTGIGLTVTKHLVEKMGGRIGFESEQGVGSTFWVELPLISNHDVLIWDGDLQVGIDAIDNDHQSIMSLINRILHEPEGKDKVGETFRRLIDYTRYHFLREETIMTACGYTDQAFHSDFHTDLIRKLERLATAWNESSSAEDVESLKDQLLTWWGDHIGEGDRDLAIHVIGKDKLVREALDAIQDSHASNLSIAS